MNTDHISSVPVALPPYALPAPAFPFRHLAGLAGRAPIGGRREVALACFLAARLAMEAREDSEDDSAPRAARCAGARAWVGTLALPAAVRNSVLKCADLTVEGKRGDVGRELAALAQAAASFLDAASRAELDALAAALRAS